VVLTAFFIAIIVLLVGSTVNAVPPSQVRQIDPAELHPVILAVDATGRPTPMPPTVDSHALTREIPSAVPERAQPTPKVKVIEKATPKPASVVPVGNHHAISGLASWYCKAGRSVCHYKYPDRPGCNHNTGANCDYYAAACGKLRVAIGSGWRNNTVRVRANGRVLNVKLVDWCGSSTKTIDLYWDAMDYFGGTGVIGVRISW
jgi:hypothetical protein